MTASNFDRCVALILKEEGGYVDHPSDPGGATKYGITQRTLATHRRKDVSKHDVQALTEKEAKDIYKANYWNAIRGDELPRGVDYAVFDYAVNSGPARAAKALQWAIGFREDHVDGHIGDHTLAETDLVVDGGNGKKLIKAICDGRLQFVRGLANWPTFGKGWTARIGRVESAAVRMLSDAEKRPAKPDAPPVTPSPPPEPVKEASRGGFWAAISALVAAVAKGLDQLKDHLGTIGDVLKMLPLATIGWVALGVVIGAGVYAWWQRRQGAFAKPPTADPSAP